MEELIKQIIDLDVRLFYFINKDLMNPVFDILMPIITDGTYLTVFLIISAVYFLIKGSRHTRIAIICMVVAVLLSDAIAYRLIKPFVGRLRPCDVLPGAHILANAGTYSFPSNHATSMMSLAVVSWYFFRRYGWLVMPAALIVGYSRVYVGVHYPLDVFMGFLWGALIAFFVILVYRAIELERNKKIIPHTPALKKVKQKKGKGAKK